MTTEQKQVLARFDSLNAGAVFFEGRWLFKQHIRDEPETAARMVIARQRLSDIFQSAGATRKNKHPLPVEPTQET